MAHGGGTGICDDPGAICNDPCPADLACYGDEDCPEGYLCPPGCDSPAYCYCDPGTSEWICDGIICAGRCIPIPEPTGPRGYTIIDLGTLGGWTGNAAAINNLGQVVGEADTPSGYRHAFLWENGVMTDLGVLQGDRISFAADINDYAQVACNSSYAGGSSWDAFLWDEGQRIELGDLDNSGALAYAINNSGQIVGMSEVYGQGRHGFLWDQGAMTDLYEVFDIRGVHDINDFGELVVPVAGEGGPHAAIWSNGTILDLGTLGGLYSFGVAINDRGEVLGSSERAPGGDRNFYMFLWTGEKMLDLDAGGTLSFSQQDALNNCGEVVVGGRLYDGDITFRKFADMIPAEARWYQFNARGINDRGQIVGYGTYQGLPRAFLMTPVPGDLEVDGDIDLRDFARFQNAWTGMKPPTVPGCERSDLDGDGDVDADDLVIFREALNGPRAAR